MINFTHARLTIRCCANKVSGQLCKADEMFAVKVSLGKEIAHPNTTEHHIRWI